jgi:hypothetical protein
VTSSGDNIDPLTNEPMGTDWVFTLRFDVVLADYPEPASDEGVPSDGA